MNDKEFKNLIKSIHKSNLNLSKKRLLSEYGDEFGPVDLGDFSDFSKIFFEPFADVVRTTKASLSKISSRTWSAFEAIAKGIPTLVVPFLSANYKNIFDKEKRRSEAIKSKYSDVFSRVSEVFDHEAEAVSFMLNPALVLSTKVVHLGADETLDIVDILSGNNEDVLERTTRLRRALGIRESLLFEDKKQDMKVVSLLRNRNFQNLLRNSSVVKDMISDARGMKNESLNDILDLIESIKKLNSVEQAEKLFRKEIDKTSIEKFSDKESKAIEDSLLESIKESALESIKDTIMLQLNEFKSQNIPEASDIVKIYNKVLSSI